MPFLRPLCVQAVLSTIVISIGCSHQPSSESSDTDVAQPNPVVEDKGQDANTPTEQVVAKEDDQSSTITANDSRTMPSIWATFRGDPQSDGIVSGSLPSDLDLLWKMELEDTAFGASVAIDQGFVYGVDLDGMLHAVSLSDGEKVWSLQVASFVDAPPAISKDRLYVGDLDGKFVCVDLKQREIIWSLETESSINSSANFHRDRVIMVTESGDLFCLNQLTGDQEWKVATEDRILSSPSIIDDQCFLTGCAGELYRVDLEKAELAGSTRLDAPTGITAALKEDRAFFAISGGAVYCIDWTKNEVVWQWQDPDGGREPASSPALTTEMLVIGGGTNKKLIGVDLATGEMKWEYFAKRAVNGSPVVAGNTAYVGSDDGRLYAIDISTGEEVWQYECGGRLAGSVAIADQKLVISNDRNALFCFGKSG